MNIREHLPLIVIAIVLAGGLYYVWRDLQATKAETLLTAAAAQTAPPAPRPSVAFAAADDADATDATTEEFTFQA